MANSTILKKIMGLTPNAEMIIRRVYRSSFFPKMIKQKKNNNSLEPINFDNIVQYLQSIGIKKGDILIVHSAYGALKPSGLSPNQIVDNLISIVGPTGTLAMPVIRKYAESPNEEDALTASVENILFTYDVQNSPVWTGILPKTLMQKEGAVTSRFPLNTLTAIGKEAKAMMWNNLEGNLPAPNGVNSPWKYCTDKNAWVVSIGTDLTHSLTMIHTAEDVKKLDWPVKNWYRKKKFKIIDGDFETEKIVLERQPKWGMLHFGERKLCADLISNKIMQSVNVEGVLIESLRAQNLYQFLNSRNKKGYPYFWVSQYLKK